ncbi:signal peptidase I [Halomicrobium sp. IBSBa]|uniref:signal peptidase I n=1 Tax=Halomicrobium sp. IBSBa TaxID=2778916 RepID=UPI001ABF82C4|nr:signal peptidase I [Halomicrobium sp. IBSBa]MBO4247642.1 signal peptidase I [Halomicrobium sp. IBSBa]
MSTLLAARSLSPGVRRWASRLGLVIGVALLVPFVLFAVPQTIGADHGFVVLSGSMEPALSPGDVIIVDGSGPVGVGDVITYDGGDAVPVTHRIVAVEDGAFVTQGDANENPDTGTVTRADVLGRVALTIPLIGYVILWVQTPAGYVTLVVAPLVLLVGGELRSWLRDRASDDTTADDGAGDQPASVATDVLPDDDPLIEALSSEDPLTDALAADDPLADALAVDPVSDETETSEPPAVAATDTISVPSLAPEPTPSASVDDGASDTVAVAVADLKLTLLAAGSLFGYAGWNVAGEVTAVGAPDPVSVGAMTGGLLGLLFAGWVTLGVWYDRQGASVASPATPPTANDDARADGGTTQEERR